MSRPSDIIAGEADKVVLHLDSVPNEETGPQPQMYTVS